ncbi:uncharacterized protein LOC134535415 [Bacillus rossius redtenbacheri]|uniref:uncharacterized protein LOC134535415 n=1 Tax=Bacillus rossius redtenbacheri TaxID=93214 RepID=UPI002FDE280C
MTAARSTQPRASWAAGDPSYREALSSLLWQPYECRPRLPSPGREVAGQSRGDPRPMESQALVPPPRTFASTEAQTEEPEAARLPRRQRRRRRAQAVPDLLHSHLPPPYCAAPAPVLVAASPPPRSQRSPRGHHYSPEEEPKSCCGVVVTQTVSIRWFIVMIAFVGICCAVVGTVLGAMRTSGREHLTVSLLMIGVGIVLITVSGVAWRLTAHDAPSCRSMLGLGSSSEADAEPNRRFVPRLPPSYGRPHHPYAAMMYPEFQYRPPPPSYQASMQEYRLRLLLLDRHPGGHTVSPPPTYRSHVGGMLR